MVKKIIKIRHLIFFLIFLSFFFYCFWQYFVPNGHVKYFTDFSGKSYYFRKFLPNDRFLLSKNKWQIFDQPVYLELATPGRFSRAKVSVDFYVSSSTQRVEAGWLIDRKNWRYQIVPIFERELEYLQRESDWSAVGDGQGLALWQRYQDYADWQSFINYPPPLDKIVIYYQSKINLQPKNLSLGELLDKPIATDVGLAGGYQIDFFHLEGDLKWNFKLLNIKDRTFDINLYDNFGNLINKNIEKNIQEDQFVFQASNLPQGLYRLEVNADNEVVTEKIISKQKYFVFNHKIKLAKLGRNDLHLFTSAPEISLVTTQPSSLSTVKFGQQELSINQTYKLIKSSIEPGLNKEIILTTDGLEIAGAGSFAFRREHLVPLRPRIFVANMNLDSEKIDYLLTQYQAPKKKGQIFSAEAVFDISQADYQNNRYQVMFSFINRPNENGSIIIKSIEIDLFRPSFLELLKNKLWSKKIN